MIRVVVACVTLEQVETLLLATRALGLTPDLGVGPSDEQPRPSRRKAGKRSTKKGKPKRYKSSMTVRMAKAPTDGAPKLQESFRLLHDEFGSKSFRKSLAKGVLAKTMKSRSGLSTYVTTLLDRGNMVVC